MKASKNTKKAGILSRMGYELALVAFLLVWFLFMGIMKPSFQNGAYW